MSLYNDLSSVLTPYANKIKQNEANVRLALSLEGGGAPTVVSSISAMTNTSQIYVLTTDGNWYYYDSSDWVSGGEYGTVATDKTLTLEDSPADAKAVGDAVNGIKAKLPEVLNSDADNVDLDISDTQGNVIARFADGHIQTKEFDSAFIGDKTALETTDKTDVVSAINEVKLDADSKVDSEQGTENVGKALVVGNDGVVVPMDISVNVDKTLTEDGEAADAKTVGEKFEKLESATLVSEADSQSVDLFVCDSQGNAIVQFYNGNIETKNFHGFKYIIFSVSDTFVPNNAKMVTISHMFKKGDRIVFHVERSNYPYNAPWNPGMVISYYEGSKKVIDSKKIDLSYTEHTITTDCDNVSMEYPADLRDSSMPFTFYVYLLGDIPITPTVVKIKKDGTGDYTNLKSALDDIGTNANSVINPYRIEIYSGRYDTLEGYTDEEIGSAVQSYTDLTFVGAKLLDGMSLIGIGNPTDIVFFICRIRYY